MMPSKGRAGGQRKWWLGEINQTVMESNWKGFQIKNLENMY